ncbi:MurR/RpiR family transcriptional regulator [Radiobacillus kanasensis]|uniref:MurR/RpiR family transcriptional regulator n=1 Tax=Radiobacillus kanasensis TaxID=2844358 RepID=UPI001E310951|nr:MurR/RpiR family transcriptional regulator [Radiobacillus kanasensis]UFT98595.1 MurR/RpiR family transcriptional regulator [Radiobacillus kanasensis]
MEQNPTKHVIQRIQSFYSGLSEKEKGIADFILQDPDKIIHSTINQVSDALNVADATVFRFCKRLGFKGYQALKIALASEVIHPIKDIHETISEKDSEETIFQKVFQSNIQALEYTKALDQDFKKAVEWLTEAEHVYFYGSGGSGIIALDGEHKFMRSGLSSRAYIDSHMQLMTAAQLREKDVAVFISHTGANKDLLEVLEIAKDCGAKTIGITNFAQSPLSKGVGTCLFTASKETEYRSEALSSRIAQLSLLDSLYIGYCMKKKEQSKLALHQVRDAIARKRV